MIHKSLAAEGLTPEFVNRVSNRIRAAILPRALDYYAEGADAYSRGNPLLKKAEMSVGYYDYQACGVSTLGALAAEGNEPALALVRRIFDNTRFYMDVWRPREGYTTPIRRAQFHLVLCYERVKALLTPDETAAWRDLLIRTAEDMLHHFNHLQERVPTLDNRGFATGINHVAIAAEGVWKTGAALGRPDWQTLAGDFIDRLVAYGHPDGYFEEHTNDAREGGPSLVYTPLTAGCAYLVQRWRGRADRERFARCGALYRNLLDARFHALAFADERANPHGLGPYGIAIHSLTPEGRGFLRMALDPDDGTVGLDRMGLESLSRMDLELDHVDTGPGAVPEPLQGGTFRIAMPLGVARSRGWTMGLSSMWALNREIAPKSDYALDRQALLHLSHERAGVILAGHKSKHDPLWSTLRNGDDAYPVRTGDLRFEPGRMVAQVSYKTFSAEVTWVFGDQPTLVMTSSSLSPLTAQLVLEAGAGDRLDVGDGRSLALSDDPARIRGIRSVASSTWEVFADQPGDLVWFVAPFNPYAAGNRSHPSSRRPVFAVEWTGRVEFRFCCRGGS